MRDAVGEVGVEAFPDAASANPICICRKMLCLPMQRDEAKGGISASYKA